MKLSKFIVLKSGQGKLSVCHRHRNAGMDADRSGEVDARRRLAVARRGMLAAAAEGADHDEAGAAGIEDTRQQQALRTTAAAEDALRRMVAGGVNHTAAANVLPGEHRNSFEAVLVAAVGQLSVAGFGQIDRQLLAAAVAEMDSSHSSDAGLQRKQRSNLELELGRDTDVKARHFREMRQYFLDVPGCVLD